MAEKCIKVVLFERYLYYCSIIAVITLRYRKHSLYIVPTGKKVELYVETNISREHPTVLFENTLGNREWSRIHLRANGNVKRGIKIETRPSSLGMQLPSSEQASVDGTVKNKYCVVRATGCL